MLTPLSVLTDIHVGWDSQNYIQNANKLYTKIQNYFQNINKLCTKIQNYIRNINKLYTNIQNYIQNSFYMI